MRQQLDEVVTADADSSSAVRQRADSVLRPGGALARLDELAVWMAGWQRTSQPAIRRPECLVFGGDHGIAAAGVSAYPADVTVAMKTAIEQSKATINALGRAVGVPVRLVDTGIGTPTADLRFGAAMSSDRFDGVVDQARAIVAGLDADVLVIGELGIGNTTSAAAVAAALFADDHAGTPADVWVGRGTGVDDEGLARKRAAVTDGMQRCRAEGVSDPLELLRHLGGTELVGMAAAVLAARQRSLPVILDGFVATAAAAVLHACRPGALDHCLVGHASAEPGHQLLLDAIGKEPLLRLEMRLGEASGAMVALPIVRMACAAVVEVPTFGEWFG